MPLYHCLRVLHLDPGQDDFQGSSRYHLEGLSSDHRHRALLGIHHLQENVREGLAGIGLLDPVGHLIDINRSAVLIQIICQSVFFYAQVTLFSCYQPCCDWMTCTATCVTWLLQLVVGVLWLFIGSPVHSQVRCVVDWEDCARGPRLQVHWQEQWLGRGCLGTFYCAGEKQSFISAIYLSYIWNNVKRCRY